MGQIMKISQLKLFKTIAEYEHITKAAKDLHVAQPALSKTIKELENELGVPLFDRIGKGIILNENGKILLKYTNKILDELDNIVLEINEHNEKIENEITLSMQIATKLLPEILSTFHTKYPDIKVSVIQEEGGDIQLFASSLPVDYESSVMLLKENLLLALPMDHPLANQKHVSLKMLKNADFISLSRSKSLGQLTSEYCNRVGFNPNIALESDSPSIVRDLVKLGLGVSLVPEISWRDIDDDKIKLLKIDEPTCIRYFYLSWNENKYQRKALVLFRNHIIEFFKQQQNPSDY